MISTVNKAMTVILIQSTDVSAYASKNAVLISSANNE